MASPELEVTADLSAALCWVLGAAPTAPEPVVVVSACLDSLAKGYGLSESRQIDWDPLERAVLPAPAVALIHHLFAGGESEIRADALRDRLYETFLGLAQDPGARRKLNRNQPLTEVELLTVGQVYWNLEARGDRTRLPIQPGQITRTSKAGNKQAEADIKVPGANKDFAVMKWAARADERGSYKSSGQGFRKQGARLAVLAAELIIRTSTRPLPDMEGAVLNHTPGDLGTSRISSISWPAEAQVASVPIAARLEQAEHVTDARSLLPEHSREAQQLRSVANRVLVGAPAELGAEYQRRVSDAEIERLWADGGDRRIWLRGGPGLGKSYSARRVMHEAVANRGADREDLLIWVDSADAASATTAFADATDQLGQLGVDLRAGSNAPAGDKARALLGHLATSTWRWLIVLDNADAGSLIEARLIPPGGNRNGRVLITTRSRAHRVNSHGRAVEAELFTHEEAEAYLRGEVHVRGRGTGPLSLAPDEETRALAKAVGYHPLALSIAAATIVANAMTVADWISEFAAPGVMDAAADEPDRGGYPHLIGATWQVALGRASEGLPEGVVERAATVAAVQDPDGHPTWLWDRPAVASWVAGGPTLVRRHGMPVAVQRLIDTGIVELRGDTWRDGQVTIHQLAARAVREGAAAATPAEIAGILAEQWLLEVTRNPSAAQPDVLRRSLRPILALPDLPTPARRTVTALLAYRQPTGAGAARRVVESLEPYLDRGGATVRIKLARLLIDVADEEAALGRAAQARTAYSRAADHYRQLVEDNSLRDGELASCLMCLGYLEAQLGNPEPARASRDRAAALLERLADTASDTSTISRHLADLVALHDVLGNQDRKTRALVRAEELLTHPPQDLPSRADRHAVLSQGDGWRTLAELMWQAGRLGTAKECLAREAAIYERFPEWWWVTNQRWAGAVKGLALLHAQTGEWSDAERHLTRLTNISQMPWADSLGEAAAERLSSDESRRDALVLLASVQTHLGRREDADQSLARAAEQYQEDTSDDDLHRNDWLDSLTDDEREEHKQFMDGLKRILEMADRDGLRMLVSDSVEKGRWEDALGLSGGLLDLAHQDADAAPGDAEAEEALADAHELMGALLHDQGLWGDAAMHATRAVDIRQLLSELDPSGVDAQRDLAKALGMQASCLAGAGRHQAGADAMTRSVSAHRQVTELAPDDRRAAMGLADALKKLARMQTEVDNLDGAVGCYEESISILGSLADQAPDDHTVQIALADALKLLGGTWLIHGRPQAAVEPLRRSNNTYVHLVSRLASGDQQARKQLAWTHFVLGVALTRTDRPEDGLTHLNEAVTAFRALADRAPDDRETQNEFASALAVLGEVQAANGQQEQAADCLSRSANILQLLADLDPGVDPSVLIDVLNTLAQTLRDLGRTVEADEALARASDLADESPDDDGQDNQ